MMPYLIYFVMNDKSFSALGLTLDTSYLLIRCSRLNDFENETNILFPSGVPDWAVMAMGIGNESIFNLKQYHCISNQNILFLVILI